MCRNQLGRRNLTDEQKSYLRGRQYEAEKMSQGGTGANQYVNTQTGQNVQSAPQTRREQQDGTSGRIGKENGEVKAPKSVIAMIRNIPEDQRPGGCNQSNAYGRNETDKNR